MFPLRKNIHWQVWLLIFLALATQIFLLHHVGHLNWLLAIEDGSCSILILSLSAWLIILIIRAYPTTAAIYPYALFIAAIFSMIATTAGWEVIKWWVVKDNLEYKKWLETSIPVRFLFSWMVCTWTATNCALRKNITVSDSRFQQQTDASVLLKEAELFKLRQQLQPHFLYNSLNSINALILISPAKAQEMIGKLSDFLRSSVQRESESVLSVNEELQYIQSYLAIESVRFGDRLVVSIEKNYDENSVLPPFLVQPILENAIKFGLYGKTGAVTINITIVTENNMLVITVSNPYDADQQPPKGTGFGLEGIRRRLYLMYARTDLLTITGSDGQFNTTLKIPQRYVQGNTD